MPRNSRDTRTYTRRSKSLPILAIRGTFTKGFVRTRQDSHLTDFSCALLQVDVAPPAAACLQLRQSRRVSVGDVDQRVSYPCNATSHPVAFAADTYRTAIVSRWCEVVDSSDRAHLPFLIRCLWLPNVFLSHGRITLCESNLSSRLHRAATALRGPDSDRGDTNPRRSLPISSILCIFCAGTLAEAKQLATSAKWIRDDDVASHTM